MLQVRHWGVLPAQRRSSPRVSDSMETTGMKSLPPFPELGQDQNPALPALGGSAQTQLSNLQEKGELQTSPVNFRNSLAGLSCRFTQGSCGAIKYLHSAAPPGLNQVRDLFWQSCRSADPDPKSCLALWGTHWGWTIPSFSALGLKAPPWQSCWAGKGRNSLSLHPFPRLSPASLHGTEQLQGNPALC